MRKFVWGIGACGVLVLGASAWSTHYAARHPQSFIGRVMHGASYAASKLTPASGFGPVLAALEKKPVAHDEVEGIPADPEPIEAAMRVGGDREQEVATSAPIVIPENDNDEPRVAAVVEGSAIKPVQHEIEFGGEVQAQGVAVLRAPSVMPLCRDEEECEVLPAPGEEADEEDSDVTTLLGKSRTEIEEIKAEPKVEDECREDPHHHYQHSACPATGRSYTCPATGSKPSCDPPKPHESYFRAPGSEESSEADETSSKTALKKMKRFKARESIDEGCPTFPKFPMIDTMEMRSSDKQLYDYGPGVL